MSELENTNKQAPIPDKYKTGSRPIEYKTLRRIGPGPIHPGAIVHCPKFSFELTAAANYCPTCEHWKGLALLNNAGQAAIDQDGLKWDQVYCVLCAYPIERKTQIVNIVR